MWLLDVLQGVVGGLVVGQIHPPAFRDAEAGQSTLFLCLLVKNHTNTVPTTFSASVRIRSLVQDHDSPGCPLLLPQALSRRL